jgi:cation:H+ antiporter
VTAFTIAILLGGIVLLVAGAESFVRGASRLAAAVGISPLVIGLTVVAFGTSSPELAVSVQSAYAGSADLALGNVVGSNIFNILLILGLSAIVAPLVVDSQLIRLDVPVMIGVSGLLLLLGIDGSIGRLDGLLFTAGGIGYTTFLIVESRRAGRAVELEYEREFAFPAHPPGGHLLSAALIAGGLTLLVFGSRSLVSAAVAIAGSFGVSELVIGLTVVAAGTSLPEVATSLIATVRGERDIAVGNVIGSSIFNILAVLGIASVVAPSGIPVAQAALRFDIPVMIAVAVACLPIFFSGNRISRWEGLLFLGYYLAYTANLVLFAAEHDVVPIFSSIMGLFILPLTLITLVIVMIRSWRQRETGSPKDV